MLSGKAVLLFTLVLLCSACSERVADAPADQATRSCCVLTIAVTVPADTPTVYLTGNLPELGPWNPGKFATQGEGTERRATLTVPEGSKVEYKFTLGSWDREALGPSGTVMANHRLTVTDNTDVRHVIDTFKLDPKEYMADWRASGVQGTMVYWPDVESKYLGPSRHVGIWLPPGFDKRGENNRPLNRGQTGISAATPKDLSATEKYQSDPDSGDADLRYPVLYMHDGQNLFDPRLRSDGIIWDVDDAIVRLVEAGEIPPVIVVGVFNSAQRGYEYSPWHGAGNYAKFLIEELMPRVNAEFPTLTGPGHTAVMGSSMGGLLSYYLVSQHPDVFGACGCISSHFSLSEAMAANYFPNMQGEGKPDKTPYIIRDIERGLTVPAGARYWFDYGTQGLDAAYKGPHALLRQALLEQGLTEGEDFVIREYAGADHNEASWRDRLEDPLRFLFGGLN